MKPETRDPKPEPPERSEVIARCPKCGEPVRQGRCTNAVKCAYTMPAARLINPQPAAPQRVCQPGGSR